MKTFRDSTRTTDFTVSSEIFLKPETTAEMIREAASLLRGQVSGVLVTDNQFGSIHMSTLAAASLLIGCGVDPIVQLACRNRNRIALLAELLGAAALGVTSLMLIRGNRVPDGFSPRPKAVMDVDATELIATASKMKNDERLSVLPDFFIGGLVTPHAPKAGWDPQKLRRKVDAGAQFVQAHVCMNMPLLRNYMKRLVATGLLRRLHVFVSLAIPGSADDARWLAENRPNVNIPEEIIRRIEQSRDAEQESVRICAELMQQLAEIPGVAGAHLVATRNLATVPAAIEASGVYKRIPAP
ncbi:MAG: methylenetetrahydrofolate reductase [Woeseiaceae bacterium]|nr:methylenetetrahydrofolate reductase [Woeseiaceae bacterium]